MNLNKNFLTEVIKYLISKGVTLADVMDTFNEHFNTLDAFNDSLKNMPTEIKRGTINNVIEEPVLPKYTMTESDKVRLESVSPSPETLNKVFDFSKEKKQYEVRKPITDIDLMLCGRSVEENSTPCQKVKKKAENTEKPVNKSLIDYPKNIKNHGNGVSPARKALFDVVGDKTVIEHLKENGITYSNFDNRIRKNWSVAEACTTPLAPRGRHKSERVIEEPGEPETAVIIPDSVKVVEETSLKTKMMLVNGRMTEMKVSDTDLVQSSIIEKPAETLETKTETLETESNTEKPTESVTNATELKGNNVTAVILDTPNHDAIRKDKDDNIEKALKKFITSTTGIKFDESKKDKKPKEAKKDYTVSDVCFKLNVTTHELRDMVSAGEFPQPDCGKKWSVKLLKEKNLI